MAKQDINLGGGPGANDGDLIHDAWVKQNANNDELYLRVLQGVQAGAADPNSFLAVDPATGAQQYRNAAGNWADTPSGPPEVITSTTDLTGPVPTGAKFGVNETTGATFYPSGGNWTPSPVSTTDLKTTIGATQPGNYAGGAPVGAPATAIIGDVFVQIYADALAFFTATAADTWPAAAQEVVQVGKPRVFADDTTVAPAATGAPTAAEIAAATAERDVIVYYTGTDTGTDPETYVFHVDQAGVATLLKEPTGASEPEIIFAATDPVGTPPTGLKWHYNTVTKTAWRVDTGAYVEEGFTVAKTGADQTYEYNRVVVLEPGSTMEAAPSLPVVAGAILQAEQNDGTGRYDLITRYRGAADASAWIQQSDTGLFVTDTKTAADALEENRMNVYANGEVPPLIGTITTPTNGSSIGIAVLNAAGDGFDSRLIYIEVGGAYALLDDGTGSGGFSNTLSRPSAAFTAQPYRTGGAGTGFEYVLPATGLDITLPAVATLTADTPKIRLYCLNWATASQNITTDGTETISGNLPTSGSGVAEFIANAANTGWEILA